RRVDVRCFFRFPPPGCCRWPPRTTPCAVSCPTPPYLPPVRLARNQPSEDPSNLVESEPAQPAAHPRHALTAGWLAVATSESDGSAADEDHDAEADENDGKEDVLP